MDETKCPDCGNVDHDPKTGYCWLSKSRRQASGFHCNHCCASHGKQEVPNE